MRLCVWARMCRYTHKCVTQLPALTLLVCGGETRQAGPGKRTNPRREPASQTQSQSRRKEDVLSTQLRTRAEPRKMEKHR